ncbi:MFS transporter [Acidihalobacter ferrooxydans]|uniref:Major facilitator superfamily (MFS) profile domain-containing protein n=1 Tax=Acidihalobacter ferrooxydans TaxID=1765967 RepID=A0A1P8UDX4_9GAMM|nr:MFS transporter [Acidihalobacter ferrooxydans]APZ41978.1 hypothetical protein BW247_01760 [Acidihalobacter ferrooxydans]
MESNKNTRINLQNWIESEISEIGTLFTQRNVIIALMAVVLGLTAADLAALGVMANALERSLHLNNASFGLIATVSTLVGAIAALPVSILVDRWNRVTLLVLLTLVWSAGMAWSGFIQTYFDLLIAQLVVGISGVSIGAVVASLTGDYFSPSQRGRIFGLIVGGEMLGGGMGVVWATIMEHYFSWHAAFWQLAGIGFIAAWLIWNYLPEPSRGRMGELARNSVCPQDAKEQPRAVNTLVQTRGIEPHAHRVIEDDPTDWPWLKAARYIITIRTNAILLTGSTASYFYFTGLLTFAELYLMQHFDLSTSAASLLFLVAGSGGILGNLLSGWLADRLLRRGIIAARVWVSASAFFLAVATFLPAFLLPVLPLAITLFFLAAFSLGATTAPLDAARLDIMHSRLWGRAEGIRNALRYIPVAFAPVIIGLISDLLIPASGSTKAMHGTGLGLSFEFLLILLLAAGIIMLFAGYSYARDVATVIASEHIGARANKEVT